jgi:hypothetical protein
MANKCLVTKLKGTVDNPELKKFGELDFTFEGCTGNYGPTTGMIDVLEIVSASEFTYEIVGTGVSVEIAPSYPLSPQPAALSGTRPSGYTYFVLTGTGKIKIVSKYNLITVAPRKNINFENVDDVRALFMREDFGIQIEQNADSIRVFDSLNYQTKFKENPSTHRVQVPVIVNAEDYANYVPVKTENTLPLSFTLFKQGGNGTHINGDLINIAQMAIDNDFTFAAVSSWFSQATGWVGDISKFTQVCAEDCTSFILLGLDATKCDKDCTKFATWKNLQFLNYTFTPEAEWKPVFDAWKALGTYNGRSVEVYVRGASNGEDVYNMGHHLVFDAQGNYSFEP